MTDRPILFSGPMVRALMEGCKTQTRRVLKPQPLLSWIVPHQPKCPNGWFGSEEGESSFFSGYQVGDRLWVRETFSATFWNAEHIDDQPNEYWSTPRDMRIQENLSDLYFKEVEAYKPLPFVPEEQWTPPIFMPRWASRLTLIITDVRVQRLQDISEADAAADGGMCEEYQDHVGEGYGLFECWSHGQDLSHRQDEERFDAPRESFADLWDGLNAKRGYGWDQNPWVVALTFDVIKQNIDAIEVAA